MSSIVLDLQNEITQHDCDIVNVLRKAHLIAVKLDLSEFDAWIKCELNGYKSGDTIPEYRIVRGELKALNPYLGWIPTMIPNPTVENYFCNKRVPNSISEIVTMCKRNENGLIAEFTGEELSKLNNMFASPVQMKYTLHFSTTAIGDIVERVKNAVLEWTIKLEGEGILGEGMQFNTVEKESAKNIPQLINNYYGNTNIINAPIEHSAVVAGNENSVEFTYEDANKMAAEIESSLKEDMISKENQEAALELLTEIKGMILQQKNVSVIRSMFGGLKEFLGGAGASATVELMQTKMQDLL